MARLATIVVVPRESFSRSIRSLESVYAKTPEPFELVYVDGNSPASIRRHLEAEAVGRGFTLLRSRRYLSPNEARNLGFAHVRTKYVVFLGNDVLVTDGWLEALVTCAEETGAAFVGGVSCVGELDGEPVIYFAGGESRIVVHDSRRGLRDVHHHAGRPLAEIREQLGREPSEAAVFHCLLVRADVLGRLGGLDERLFALEHVDFCIRAKSEANGGWFEPRSVVTHVPPPSLRASDVPYFLLRWSQAWIDSSVAHFCRTWDIEAGGSGLQTNRRWLHAQRGRLLGRLRPALRNRAGERVVMLIDALIDGIVANTLVRRDSRRRLRSAPNVPHLDQTLRGHSGAVDRDIHP